MARKYKCPYCNNSYIRKDLVNHIDKEHDELLGDDHTSSQIVFDLVNGTKGHGKCRVCGKPTNWNESSARYGVLCNNPKCKEHMREEYKKNMLKVYNTYNILTSDEQQKKMLANRKISGKYKFKDGGIVTYTGSYEKKFLQFIDIYMNIPSKDIMAPGPTIEYEMNGEKHFYITDFLYIPYNAIIEIKDGGSNLNHKDSEGMRSSRQRTIEKEKIITNQGVYNYLRLTDNQFMQFLEFCMEIKRMLIEGRDDKIIKVNENYITEATKNSKYYICLKSYEGKTLTSKPSIPKDNFLIDKGYEDGKTSRVCASNSINGCLMAMSMNLKNKDLFVYSVDFNNDNLPYKPTKAEVPDAHVTGEVWFKKPVTLKYIGKIHVDEADKDVVYASDIAGIKNPAVVDWKYHFVERINESAEDNKVGLNQYKQIDMTPRNINKYGLTRVNPMCDGYIYIDEKNNNGVVGYVSVEKKLDGRKWIQSIEVETGYRNLGLLYQLIDIACTKLGAKFISVNKINKPLKNICGDYGFKVYDQNEYTYFMTTNEELVKDIKSALKESSNNDMPTFESPEDLYEWMSKNIKYHHANKFRSAEEVYKELKGDCHDQSEFEHKMMTKMKIPHGRYFLITYSDDSIPWYEQNCGPTHTALWYQTNKGYYWFENAWYDKRGIHGPYTNKRQVKDAILSEYKKYYRNSKFKYAHICKLASVKPGMSLGDYVMAHVPMIKEDTIYSNDFNFKSFYMIGIEKARTNLISIYSDYNLNGLKITNPYCIDNTNTYVIAQIDNRQCTKEDLDNVIAEINSDNRFTVYGKNGYFRVFKKAIRSSKVILIAIEININD